MRKQNYSQEQQQTLLNELADFYGKDVLTSAEIDSFCKKNHKAYPHFIYNPKANFKVKWGHYRVRGVEVVMGANQANVAAMIASVSPVPAPSAITIDVAVGN